MRDARTRMVRCDPRPRRRERQGRLKKIPLDDARRLAAEYLDVAFLGHHPFLEMKLLGGGGQIGAELDGAVPIAALPAIHVVELMRQLFGSPSVISMIRLEFVVVVVPTAGMNVVVGGSFTVVPDTSGRIASRHLREAWEPRAESSPSCRPLAYPPADLSFAEIRVDDRDGERRFLRRDRADREHEVRGAELDIEGGDLRRRPDQRPQSSPKLPFGSGFPS